MTDTFPRHRAIAIVMMILLVGTLLAIPGTARADVTKGQMVDYEMVFPVQGDHYFFDSFGAYRSHGRGHEGQDIMADKGTPAVAVADGTVRYVNWTANPDMNPDRCCSVVIKHDDGWESRYLHMNNDDPGTDNGHAWGIAKGIVPGVRVEAGQLIGWAGDSGNAEGTPPHIHFELRDPNGVLVNPFEALIRAGGNPPPTGLNADTDPLLSSDGVLHQGDRGETVRRLQELLEELGYDPGPIDGIFGPRTAAAVLSFQADLGLQVDGVVGSQTKGAVAGSISTSSTVLGFGSRGPEVAEAQAHLASLGFNPGPADGVFGPRTLDAVLAFQRSLGLQVDGLVGPQTKASLGID